MGTIPDILGLGQDIVDLLSTLGWKVSLFWVDIILLAVVAFIVLCAVVGGIVKVVRWWRKPISESEKYIQDALGVDFRDQIHPKTYKKYIRTQFQNIPPNNFEDPRQSLGGVASKDLTDFYLEQVFTNDNTNNDMYCILAGSGMGKTTFLVHLFCEYVRKYRRSGRPFDIVLFPLSSDKALSSIAAVPHPESTILLLDALDESTDAVANFEDYVTRLEAVISRFRFVVLSCRTQFFDSEQEELQQSRIRSLSSDKGFKRYNRHYLAPWCDKDIRKYLFKQFGKWGKRRRKADAILRSCHDVMVRPLLLSYIKDLVASDIHIEQAVDLYEALILKWIERETNGIPDAAKQRDAREQLALLSRLLAVNIYQNQSARSGLYIPKEDFEHFSQQYDFACQYPFKQRSLINRDSHGDVKFAHKSFLEFFLAQERATNPDFALRFEGMDMARRFYQELIDKRLKEYRQDGILELRRYPETPKLSQLHQYPVYTLQIYRPCDINFTDITTAYHIVRVSVEADAINHQLQEWLAKSQISVVNIRQTSRLKGQLGFLFKIPELELIELDVTKEKLSNNFLQKVVSGHLSLSCNDSIAIQGDSSKHLWTTLAIVNGMRRNQQELLAKALYEIFDLEKGDEQ